MNSHLNAPAIHITIQILSKPWYEGINLYPYSDATKASWCLKSPAIWMHLAICLQAFIKERDENQRYWPILVGIRCWTVNVWFHSQRVRNAQCVSTSYVVMAVPRCCVVSLFGVQELEISKSWAPINTDPYVVVTVTLLWTCWHHPKLPSNYSIHLKFVHGYGILSFYRHVLILQVSWYDESLGSMVSIPTNCLNTLRPRQNGPVSQTTLSNAFSWMKMLEFRFRFHWSLFLRVQLAIIQHWVR